MTKAEAQEIFKSLMPNMWAVNDLENLKQHKAQLLKQAESIDGRISLVEEEIKKDLEFIEFVNRQIELLPEEQHKTQCGTITA